MAADEALAILDEDGEELILDTFEATAVLAVTGGFEAATVSACPTCRSRVLACVALTDLLGDVAMPPRGRELADLAEDAPTLHLYVQDLATTCVTRPGTTPGSPSGPTCSTTSPARRAGCAEPPIATRHGTSRRATSPSATPSATPASPSEA